MGVSISLFFQAAEYRGPEGALGRPAFLDNDFLHTVPFAPGIAECVDRNLPRIVAIGVFEELAFPAAVGVIAVASDGCTSGAMVTQPEVGTNSGVGAKIVAGSAVGNAVDRNKRVPFLNEQRCWLRPHETVRGVLGAFLVVFGDLVVW